MATLTTDRVGGARLSAPPLEAWTTTDGRFVFEGQGTRQWIPIVVEHPEFVTRAAQLAWAPSRDDAVVDIIRNAAPFDLSFYRQLVRDDKDRPGLLRTLRRWTTAPSWFLMTTTLDSNRPLTPGELEKVEAGIRASVLLWTGGTYAASVVARGTTPPTGSGWVVVRFEDEPESHPTSTNYCGYAQIGLNPGEITLVRNCIGRWGHWIVAHEVGHAMGFWHVEDRGENVMGNDESVTSVPSLPSAKEQYHARIAYSRQPGNADPDIDSILSVPLAWSHASELPPACGG